ncbi:hypothetical protein L6452_14968 [Arctium lappa]|uniref:Uncharacterized protein n=1 Tax=Arctium lappa TaxID=4217 RepID=A0ACB9CMH8_ARCLA|nr:hypothetical protein L6452_14968 [Arctium lappa]
MFSDIAIQLQPVFAQGIQNTHALAPGAMAPCATASTSLTWGRRFSSSVWQGSFVIIMVEKDMSPFDALCSESTGRKRLVTNTNIKDSSPTESVKIKDSHHHHPSSSPPSADIKKPSKLQMRPRFAPEFDGVYCFETIVPY